MPPLTPADLGPLADDPKTLREAKAREQLRKAEQRELMRIAATSSLANGGRHLTAQERAVMRRRAAIKPLGRALTTGEPQR